MTGMKFIAKVTFYILMAEQTCTLLIIVFLQNGIDMWIKWYLIQFQILIILLVIVSLNLMFLTTCVQSCPYQSYSKQLGHGRICFLTRSSCSYTEKGTFFSCTYKKNLSPWKPTRRKIRNRICCRPVTMGTPILSLPCWRKGDVKNSNSISTVKV